MVAPEEVLHADVDEVAPEGGQADIIYAQGRTARHRVGQWLALKAANPALTKTEAAKMLGLSPRTLQTILYRAAKEGWLKFEDPLARIEYKIIPKVLDNIEHMLNEGNERVTLETAKGTVFRQYQESKGISDGASNVLALKIETPPGMDIQVVSGKIVGKPRFSELDEPQAIEGEVA